MMLDLTEFNAIHKTESDPCPNARLIPIAWRELSSLPKRASLISDLLDIAGMSVVYGASGCGKTFLALDLAAHIVLGWNWRERKLNQGTAIYIAAEGGLGIEERLTGFRVHHKIDVTDVPLYVIAEPMDLCRSAEDVALLTERCDRLSPVSLIVVDTLSRVMAGGNENAPDDMGRFVANCDRLRLSTGAHVLVIHHSGKDDGRGARGHSLLKAAADTEIVIEKDEVSGVVTATVAKQRDHRIGDLFAFRLIPVEIGTDENGEPVTSCVVEPETGSVVRTEAKRQRDPKAAQIALRALAEAVDEQGAVPPSSNHIPTRIKVVSVSVWRQQAYLRGISTSSEERARQQAFKRASEHLIGVNRVGIWDDQVWLIA
jgi:hypothetical protein